MAKNETGQKLVYVSLVAIVAIVAIVVLLTRGGTSSAAQTATSPIVLLSDSSTDDNLGGQAMSIPKQGSTFRGNGRLEATGSGIMSFKGATYDAGLDLTLSASTIKIYDYAGDSVVEATGFGLPELEQPEKGTLTANAIRQPDKIYTYEGDGSLSATGSNIVFIIEGTNADVSLYGDGIYALKGHGSMTFTWWDGRIVGPLVWGDGDQIQPTE
ncbi:hypothetical protein CMO92_03320 [Candidatus Woesearchaeota archaeon]|nr:hypothetical protein [Candidatus Woesearchaeota archaeon]